MRVTLWKLVGRKETLAVYTFLSCSSCAWKIKTKITVMSS